MNHADDQALLEDQLPVARSGPPNPFWKRALDIACILVVLPIAAPLMLLIALVVKMGSAGPVLFYQERIGYLGRRFRFFKFRTMAVGADTTVHKGHCSRLISSNLPMVKMDLEGDPRVIPFGCWLRASGLDELPQLFNVLRNEMSLVGPRPCMQYEYVHYLPWHKERFRTLPGLTGLWQVSGKNKTTFDEMVRLDIYYSRNKSLWLDAKILLQTVPTVLLEVREKRRQMKMKSSAAFPATRADHQTANSPVPSPARESAPPSSKPVQNYVVQESA